MLKRTFSLITLCGLVTMSLTTLAANSLALKGQEEVYPGINREAFKVQIVGFNKARGQVALKISGAEVNTFTQTLMDGEEITVSASNYIDSKGKLNLGLTEIKLGISGLLSKDGFAISTSQSEEMDLQQIEIPLKIYSEYADSKESNLPVASLNELLINNMYLAVFASAFQNQPIVHVHELPSRDSSTSEFDQRLKAAQASEKAFQKSLDQKIRSGGTL